MAIVTGAPGAVALTATDRAAALAAVKAQLRAGLPDDDGLILAFAETALGLAEHFTGQVLIAREMVATIRGHGEWQALPARPVRAISGAAVDIDNDGVGWVRVEGEAAVTFTAGLASDWDSLPITLRQGVVALAAHLFTDREGAVPVPAAVTALWRPFRHVALTLPRSA
ncbi:hypothetical protein [Sphingomonas sp.]|uniref:hypothetical protein n=1 Tax=Sphingomonas sp. TaxID=28214 RepID=UPI0035C806A2